MLGVPQIQAPQAVVGQLDEDPRIVLVDPVGEPRQFVDELGVVDPRHVRCGTAALAGDDARALKNEAGTRLRRRFEFVDERLHGVGAIASTFKQRRAVEPVRQQSADAGVGVDDGRRPAVPLDEILAYTPGRDSVRRQDTISTSSDPDSPELCRDD